MKCSAEPRPHAHRKARLAVLRDQTPTSFTHITCPQATCDSTLAPSWPAIPTLPPKSRPIWLQSRSDQRSNGSTPSPRPLGPTPRSQLFNGRQSSASLARTSRLLSNRARPRHFQPEYLTPTSRTCASPGLSPFKCWTLRMLGAADGARLRPLRWKSEGRREKGTK